MPSYYRAPCGRVFTRPRPKADIEDPSEQRPFGARKQRSMLQLLGRVEGYHARAPALCRRVIERPAIYRRDFASRKPLIGERRHVYGQLMIGSRGRCREDFRNLSRHRVTSGKSCDATPVPDPGAGRGSRSGASCEGGVGMNSPRHPFYLRKARISL